MNNHSECEACATCLQPVNMNPQLQNLLDASEIFHHLIQVTADNVQADIEDCVIPYQREIMVLKEKIKQLQINDRRYRFIQKYRPEWNWELHAYIVTDYSKYPNKVESYSDVYEEAVDDLIQQLNFQ